MNNRSLYRGKREDNGEWVFGNLIISDDDEYRIATSYLDGYAENLLVLCAYKVIPKSVGQYTGMTEFVVTDELSNDELFEGDIVEVNSQRRPIYENARSKYDCNCKVRAIIEYDDSQGCFCLNYDNSYNHNIEEIKGKETSERTVKTYTKLYDFGYHGVHETWYREHNAHYNYYKDIVKIGTIYDNPELLEVI